MAEFGIGVCTGVVVEMMKCVVRLIGAHQEVPIAVREMLRAEVQQACMDMALAQRSPAELAHFDRQGRLHHQQEQAELRKRLQKMTVFGHMMGMHEKLADEARHHEGMAAQYALAEQGQLLSQLQTEQLIREFWALKCLYKEDLAELRRELGQRDSRMQDQIQRGLQGIMGALQLQLQLQQQGATNATAGASAAPLPALDLSPDPNLGRWLEELCRRPESGMGASSSTAAASAAPSRAPLVHGPGNAGQPVVNPAFGQAPVHHAGYPTVYPACGPAPVQQPVPAYMGYGPVPGHPIPPLDHSSSAPFLFSNHTPAAHGTPAWVPAAASNTGHGGPPQLTQRSAPVHKCKGCSDTCRDCRLLMLRNCKQRIVRLGTGLGARKFYCLRDLKFGRQCSTLGREGPQCNSCLAFQEVNPHLKNDAGYFIPLVTISHAAATAGVSALHCGRTSPSRRNSTIICQFCHQCSSCKRLEALVLTRS